MFRKSSGFVSVEICMHSPARDLEPSAIEPIPQDATAMGVVGMTVGECRYIFEDGIICGVVDTTVPSFFRTETRRSVCDWTVITVDFLGFRMGFYLGFSKKTLKKEKLNEMLLTFSVGELTETCRSVHLDLYICQALFNEFFNVFLRASPSRKKHLTGGHVSVTIQSLRGRLQDRPTNL